MLVPLLLSLLAPAHAHDVVVFGDSWADGAADELQTVLWAHGLYELTVDGQGIGGTTAAYWATEAPDALHAAVSENPDARWVWLSIAGNDVFHHHSSGEAATSAADNDTHLRKMLDDLFAVHPDVRVVMFGYDFVNFEQSASCVWTAWSVFGQDATSLTVNTAFLEEVGAVQEAVAEDYWQVTYVPTIWGTLQEAGGIPTAPDPNLPSPADYFADCIHPTSFGYSIILDKLVAAYWGDPDSAAWADPPEPDDTGDTGGTGDTGANDDTGASDNGADDDTGSPDPIAGHCGCATPTPAPPWAALAAIAWLLGRRRQRASVSSGQ